MKISHIFFTLCAASTPICHSMQLARKANFHQIKQMQQIASQKQFYGISKKPKQQKEDNCNKKNSYNNFCIFKNNEPIKDLAVQFYNKLQSRICTYSSNFFTEDETANKLLAGNIMANVMHVSFALAYVHPGFLIPIIINVGMIRAIKLEETVTNRAGESQLVTDLMSYVEATGGPVSFCFQDDINKRIEEHKQIDVQILSSLNLKAKVDAYYVKLAELEEEKDRIDNETFKPFLPLLNKHKNTNIGECLSYVQKKLVAIDRSELLVVSSTVALFSGIVGMGIIYGPIIPPLMLAIVPNIPFFLTNKILDYNRRTLPETMEFLQRYKDYVEKTKNIDFIEIAKKQKNIE